MVHVSSEGDVIRSGFRGLRARCCECPYTERRLFESAMQSLAELVEMGEPEEKPGPVETNTISDQIDHADPTIHAFNLDFSTLESPDVLETFDFDSFLNQNVDADFGGVFDFRLDGLENDPYTFVSDKCFLLPDDRAGNASSSEDRRKILEDALRKHPHSACQAMFPGTTIRRPRQALSVALLRACRQVYGEANAVFWTTNTFSFSYTNDFTRFVKDRNRLTRAMIARMHFDVACQGALIPWERMFRHSALVSSLKSLKVLNVRVSELSPHRPSCIVDDFLDAFRPFGGLKLQDVTVTIADHMYSNVTKIWPYEEHIAAIERMRRGLLQPGPVF